MNIDELKSTWQNAGNHFLSNEDVLKLTRINNHRVLKNMRLKLIWEITLFSAFLILYYDALDGNKRPLYVNIMLVLSLSVYITGNIIAYLFIKNPVQHSNIKASLEKRQVALRRIVGFWILATLFYAASLLTFLTSSVTFTSEKYGIVAGLAAVGMILFFVSFRKWKKNLVHFEKLIEEF